MIERVHDATLPLYAAWSLESPVYTAMICAQVHGNETRVIGSAYWLNASIAECLDEALTKFPWRSYHTHILPGNDDGVWQAAFDKYGEHATLAPELRDPVQVTRELFATLKIDNAVRHWTGEENNNQDFVNALNQHAPRVDDYQTGFVLPSEHSQAKYYTRALEVLAAWIHAGNATPGAYGPAPDYRNWDKAVI